MKTKITRTKLTNDTMMCVLRGFYDENGQYCEMCADDVLFCDLPQFVREEIRPEFDVTALIYPRTEFFAFAKQTPANLADLHNAVGMKQMFESYADYNLPNGRLLWTAGDFRK